MTGEFLDVAFHEYLADHGRFSGSFLDQLERDPLAARDMLLGKPESPPTDEMRLGKYGHALVLEGAEVASQRIALPPTQHIAYRALTAAQKPKYAAYNALSGADRRVVDDFRREASTEQKRTLKTHPEVKRLIDAVGTKRITRVLQDPSPEGAFRTMERKGVENDELWEDFVQSAKGRTIIRHEQIPTATAMNRAILRHPQASKLLAKGKPEVSMHWDCPHTGQLMKGRLDWLTDDDELVELKFTNFVSPENINRWLGSGWGRKSGLYLDAYKATRGKPGRMWWIFVEMTADNPKVHTCWVDEDHLFVRAGRDGVAGRYRGYIDLIRWGQNCKSTGHWRHPWQDVQDGSMIVPDWLASVVERDEKLVYGDAERMKVPSYG